MRYVLIDNTQTVINAVVWDGVTDWPIPDDYTAVQSDVLQLGDTYTPEQ